MKLPTDAELEKIRAQSFKAIEDVAQDWLQANPRAHPKRRASAIAGVPCGNADMERMAEYVHTNLPDEVEASGAMLQVVLNKVAWERDQQFRAMPWWRRPAKWWQVWKPQSGLMGGMVLGVFLVAIWWFFLKSSLAAIWGFFLKP